MIHKTDFETTTIHWGNDCSRGPRKWACWPRRLLHFHTRASLQNLSSWTGFTMWSCGSKANCTSTENRSESLKPENFSFYTFSIAKWSDGISGPFNHLTCLFLFVGGTITFLTINSFAMHSPFSHMIQQAKLRLTLPLSNMGSSRHVAIADYARSNVNRFLTIWGIYFCF